MNTHEHPDKESYFGSVSYLPETILIPFMKESAKIFLHSDEDNCLYSPLSLFLALVILAQTVSGTCRDQILQALGSYDLNGLIQLAKKLVAESIFGESKHSALANALFVNDKESSNEKLLHQLSDEGIDLSVFKGSPSSSKELSLLQKWVDEKTGGFLQDKAGDIKLDQDCLLAIFSTLLVQAAWRERFWPEETKQGLFYYENEVFKAEFMHGVDDQYLYDCEHFSAIHQVFKGKGSCIYLLPKDGVNYNSLITSGELIEFFFSDPWNEQKSRYYLVHQAVPKFDLSSEIDLKSPLKKLNISNVLKSDTADFSPLFPEIQEPAFLTQADQLLRIKIDEKGLEAASFTRLEANVLGVIDQVDEAYFILNRPFFFALCNETGFPAVIGLIRNPGNDRRYWE